jgi:ABC-type Fe3+/spermidine/putrescine transport system ATPase subunit
MAVAKGDIELAGVYKRFGDMLAVDGVNLKIPDGAYCCFLGPSGCGKTTTLRMLAGFEQPTDGQIFIDGVDVAQTPAHKRPVNTVFQSYALFPHLDVFDNLAFGLRMHGETKAAIAAGVRQGLDLVQLAGLERRYPRARSS